MPDLYFAKAFDRAAREPTEPVLVDSADFTTHGIVIGMTGSGKTGLSVGIIEEMLSAKVPVIVIDPKGDMTNLALSFERLAPEQFLPWVDAGNAQREGKSPEQAAAEAAELWVSGLGDWGIDQAKVAAYAAGKTVRILTPGSAAGISINLIDSMSPPDDDYEANQEEYRDEIDSIVTALLSLIGVKSDPVSGREYILLFSLIENAWRNRQGLNLEALIGQVGQPPIEKVGALPLEMFYPQKDRTALMLALNNLLASPPFEAWRKGVAIDIDAWLQPVDGKTPANVVYTAHLNDDERLLITALLLNKIVSWMRRQPGTSELRCLVYMDEIFGYFPPTMNPPTKKPLLTLLKQARAYGVGVLLATQNPVDLDYRGLANMGFWAIGRLQTTQDQERVKEGIEAALAEAGGGFDFDSMIAGVQKRVFLMHDIHRKAPELIHSRFAMSYLRGPVTLDEVRRLAGDIPAAAATPTPVPAAAPPPAATRAPVDPAPADPPPAAPTINAPPLAGGLKARFLRQAGGTTAYPVLFVKASATVKNGGTSSPLTKSLGFAIGAEMSPEEVLAARPALIDDSQIADAMPAGLDFAPIPAWLHGDDDAPLRKAVKALLDEAMTTSVLYDPVTRTTADAAETPEAFALRLRALPEVSSKRASIESKIAQKQADLAARRAEESSRQMGKWADLGSSIIGGILGGRRRSAGSILRKAGSTRSSRGASTIARLESEIASLAAQLDQTGNVDPARFEFRAIKPAKSAVNVLRQEILWVY